MTNPAFVSQAQQNTKQNLQKLEGFAGMYASLLLEVATKSLCQSRSGQIEGR
jgi:hypothetical protein